VISACTVNPILIDMYGLAKLSSNLSEEEERLQWLVDQFNTASIQNRRQQYLSLKLNSKIPDHLTWLVKMWHFGKDSLTGIAEKSLI